MEELNSTIVYQPIVSLHAKDGYAIDGHELLSRFPGKDTQSVICSLERSGDIVKFEQDFILKALNISQQQPASVSFNISNASVGNREFLNFVRNSLLGRQFPNAKIEITETYKPDPEMLNEFIRICHDSEIQVGIDDFGSGFANLALINQSSFDFVKIDGELTKKFDSCIETRSKILDVISAARANNMSITIERIERAEQILMFESLGINKGQGHLFGMPRTEPYNNFDVRINMIRSQNNKKTLSGIEMKM